MLTFSETHHFNLESVKGKKINLPWTPTMDLTASFTTPVFHIKVAGRDSLNLLYIYSCLFSTFYTAIIYKMKSNRLENKEVWESDCDCYLWNRVDFSAWLYLSWQACRPTPRWPGFPSASPLWEMNGLMWTSWLCCSESESIVKLRSAIPE